MVTETNSSQVRGESGLLMEPDGFICSPSLPTLSSSSSCNWLCWSFSAAQLWKDGSVRGDFIFRFSLPSPHHSFISGFVYLIKERRGTIIFVQILRLAHSGTVFCLETASIFLIASISSTIWASQNKLDSIFVPCCTLLFEFHIYYETIDWIYNRRALNSSKEQRRCLFFYM